MTIRKSALFAACAIVGIGLTVGSCTSRRPMNAPWCFTNSDTGNMYCEYEALKQCEATRSGLGGTCGPNPRYGRNPGDGPPASRRR